MESLCPSCIHVRKIISGTGSCFFLCEKAREEKMLPKYPAQPMRNCEYYGQNRVDENY